MTFLKAFVLGSAVLCAPSMAAGAAAHGTSPSTALESCKALQSSGGGMLSGVYWVQPAGAQPRTVYCDMETNGGGWALVYNSILGINTTDFWNIAYLDRFGRRGRPSLDALFYDGSLYLNGTSYMDVIEDLQGKTVVAMTAWAEKIDPYSMRFVSPQLVSGNAAIYQAQFAGGWSTREFDGDTWSGNCASYYANVTQHYSACWYYNLGADADPLMEDGRVGPHLHSVTAQSLGLSTDGSEYTRVRRISRFVKW
ncbi:fibrinogen-like YCDxxxxGGGW domain-containing protein [Stigmatella sp. ncwal1]|uniref:Fibrinogen-like YCDxxxxGGGW domain-containing protein n=1 Tax=Stigmatella ashevillensis TaxID=2995309 RepID=A0ABT5DMD0_9BACT|nr:fibrinogen-like YCDxxxxGGGW domain-containing protein [Stigmatella ashevillena]MDC0714821.1 fibrinogen-like YCDxxxxGGGW domain-containing protein [Stigmatella ashevillena]